MASTAISWTGTIPSSLGSLSNLEDRYLWGNRSTGDIPSWLGSLSNLTDLWLSNNQLTGEIPSELGRPEQLGVAVPRTSNQLTGAIPAELGNLSNLTDLYLAGNQLTGCVPAGLRDVADNDIAQLGLPFCGTPATGDRDVLVALYNATGGRNWTHSANWLSNRPLNEWHGVTTDASGRVTRIETLEQSVDWHDTGLAGQPEQSDVFEPPRQSVDRGDTVLAGQPEQSDAI